MRWDDMNTVNCVQNRKTWHVPIKLQHEHFLQGYCDAAELFFGLINN